MAVSVFSTVAPLLLIFLSASPPYVNGNLVLDVECSFVTLSLATCFSFVMIGSQVDKPDDLCCSGLKKVLDTKPECLCVALKNSASMGIKVNVTKAATLPAVCKLDAPPTTTACSSMSPASLPAPSPHSGSSLIPISGLSFAISGALVILFSFI